MNVCNADIGGVLSTFPSFSEFYMTLFMSYVSPQDAKSKKNEVKESTSVESHQHNFENQKQFSNTFECTEGGRKQGCTKYV